MRNKKFVLVQALWNTYKPLIQEGYQALDKTIVLSLPAASMPAESSTMDTGIGSPYGKGALRIWRFWQNTIHKIMLGPVGKTEAKTYYSPYLASWDYNPFLVDLEQLQRQGLVSSDDLKKLYHTTKRECFIDFYQVEQSYNKILKIAWKNSKSSKTFSRFCNDIIKQQQAKFPFTYIADIPINIPESIHKRHPDWFLKDFCLGAPPDEYSPEAQKWGFPVLNPKAFVSVGNRLGPAARMFKRLLKFYLNAHINGIRLDHFIGWVDPYCFYTGTKNYDNGRLFSSPEHPLLKDFYLKNQSDFLYLTNKFLMPLVREFNLSTLDIYPEDLGMRPPAMDYVLRNLHFGKMLPIQFNDPTNPQHMYHLANALPEDMAVIDTHDSNSLQTFFNELSEQKRNAFAQELARDLRFNYTQDLAQPNWLYRMQWAAALASPARRVLVFFTTLMGQSGRYNTPGVLDSWHLRCCTNFEEEYFKALKSFQAYNPFEAIRWAIYARDDDFYHAHRDLVQRLQTAEENLFNALQNL